MHNPYRMNSPTGKEILALLREGDYAHPGEETAIDLAIEPVVERMAQARVLDVGCGRGGTAGYLRLRGFSHVSAFDIDVDAVEYARKTYSSPTYPNVEFRVGDVFTCDQLYQGRRFDVIIVMSVLYLFDEAQLLDIVQRLHTLAAPGAHLIVSDYTKGSVDVIGERDGWRPLDPPKFVELAQQAGWRVEDVTDNTANFTRWYTNLVGRADALSQKIHQQYGHEWFTTVKESYGNQLIALRRGALGGGVFRFTQGGRAR